MSNLPAISRCPCGADFEPTVTSEPLDRVYCAPCVALIRAEEKLWCLCGARAVEVGCCAQCLAEIDASSDADHASDWAFEQAEDR